MSVLSFSFFKFFPILGLVASASLASCTPGLRGSQNPIVNSNPNIQSAPNIESTMSPELQSGGSAVNNSTPSQTVVTQATFAGNAVNQLLTTRQCSGCNLAGVDLEKADLRGVDLSNANLVRADLEKANLSGANLSGANLSGADLEEANLSGANLRGANFTGADLEDAIFTGADVTGANFTGAKLKGAIGLP